MELWDVVEAGSKDCAKDRRAFGCHLAHVAVRDEGWARNEEVGERSVGRGDVDEGRR
jgi:hypothetical protein